MLITPTIRMMRRSKGDGTGALVWGGASFELGQRVGDIHNRAHHLISDQTMRDRIVCTIMVIIITEVVMDLGMGEMDTTKITLMDMMMMVVVVSIVLAVVVHQGRA